MPRILQGQIVLQWHQQSQVMMLRQQMLKSDDLNNGGRVLPLFFTGRESERI